MARRPYDPARPLGKRLIASLLAASLVTTPMVSHTADLNAEFPAVGARQMGWTSVPLMCGHEMSVPGSLPMCLRILLHVNTDKGPHEVQHVYIRGASALRPDLSTSTFSTAR